jgi:hypothetical protein
VPSNYITRLVGEDLMEFHQSVVVGGGSGPNTEIAEEGWSTSIPQVRLNIRTIGQVNIHTTGQNQHQYHWSGSTSIQETKVNIHTKEWG